VIIGGGFGGLEAALTLAGTSHAVTVVDRRNYHLFQPLLYQVATGGLSPGDISSPLRGVLKKARNTTVLMGEAVDVRPEQKLVILRDGEVEYDRLVVATGVSHHYFGNEDWENDAPGLKTIEDALEIRRRILRAFEAAERTTAPDNRPAWLTFVIVGAGPTGVEMAGAIGELANSTLKHNFRNIDPGDARIYLLDGADRVLPPYPEGLSDSAGRALASLGVTAVVGAKVTGVDKRGVHYEKDGSKERIGARTVLWAAGVAVSPLGRLLSERTGAKTDNSGRIRVKADLTVAGYPDIFVIGDLASVDGPDGGPLPGTAPVAMQQGRYVGRKIAGKIPASRSFRYKDKGSLAVIGRHAAVAAIGRWRFSGPFAWLLWVFIHIAYLIEYDNRLLVLIQWAINYFTRKRGARLITNETRKPLVDNSS
jgi:NADH dehydrogenase